MRADRTLKTKSKHDRKCGQMGARMWQQAAGKGESDNEGVNERTYEEARRKGKRKKYMRTSRAECKK